MFAAYCVEISPFLSSCHCVSILIFLLCRDISFFPPPLNHFFPFLTSPIVISLVMKRLSTFTETTLLLGDYSSKCRHTSSVLIQFKQISLLQVQNPSFVVDLVLLRLSSLLFLLGEETTVVQKGPFPGEKRPLLVKKDLCLSRSDPAFRGQPFDRDKPLRLSKLLLLI